MSVNMSRSTALLLASVLGSASLGSAVEATEVNRIVLRVNDRIATLYDYELAKQDRLAMLARTEMPEARKQEILATLGEAVMKDLFDEMLILSRADQLDIRVPEEEIDAAVEQTKASFGIETEEQFQSALISNQMTLESLREQIERNLVIRKVFGREVSPRIDLEEEDLRRYYQQHPEEFEVPARRQLREVVVLDSSDLADAERNELARELRSKILEGEGDETIATHEEQGLTTGWIDLGWVEVGDLDPQLEDALEGLEVGAVSKPTPARGGLHVLQVVEDRKATLKEFQEVRDQIRAREGDRLFQAEMEVYVRELEEKALIESYPPPDAAGFRTTRGAPELERVDPFEVTVPAAEEELPESETEAEEPSGG
jgi:peptidyl-prolyl cis-trans isomerase SurA